MIVKITPIPSANIYEFDCDLDLIDRAFANIKSHTFQWNDPDNFTSAGYLDIKTKVSWYHEELFNWMQSCIDFVSKKTLNIPLAITDSWVTKTEYTQRSTVHRHSWSVFSGVLYFSEHKSSTLKFEYNDHNITRFGKIADASQHRYLEFIPTKGKFLVFPSDTYHFIQVHTEPRNIRYSLAINTFFNGEIADDVTVVLQNNVVTVEDRYLRWKAQQDNL